MLTSPQNWVNQGHGFRRRYERKNYRVEVVFAHEGRIFEGRLMDIGLGGAYIQTREVNRFWEGDTVSITIPFTNGGKHVRRTGRISWKNNLGIAIAFSD